MITGIAFFGFLWMVLSVLGLLTLSLSVFIAACTCAGLMVLCFMIFVLYLVWTD